MEHDEFLSQLFTSTVEQLKAEAERTDTDFDELYELFVETVENN